MLDEAWAELGDADARAAEEIEGARFVPLRLHELQKPSIAAVNGYAMGLGMGIALSCDVRIASENARMSETFIRRGLIPADGSCWQLPRMIGLGGTMLLQYTGAVLDSGECLRLGIVNRVVEHGELMERTLDLARQMAEGPHLLDGAHQEAGSALAARELRREPAPCGSGAGSGAQDGRPQGGGARLRGEASAELRGAIARMSGRLISWPCGVVLEWAVSPLQGGAQTLRL